MEGISVQDECGKCGEVHTGPCGPRTPEHTEVLAEKPPQLRRKRARSTPNVFECETCKKSFNSKAKLIQHRYVHTGEKPFVCATCGKGFSSKFRLVRHVLIHSDSPKYACSICAKNFHRKDHLKTHAKTHGRQTRLDCADCGKSYTSSASFRRHRAFHSAQGGHLKCELCRYEAQDKDSILHHLKARHSGSRGSRAQERKHTCPACGRSFFMKKEMWRHTVVHTGRRDFLCQFCPQAYRRHDHLLRHIRKRHSEAERPARQSPVPEETPPKTGLLPNFKDAFQS
ncbi:zinc finger protein PLAG1-like [Cimex lectularius]|uniref:C2H2-type domain-containing protein n=1 Tax=Cimex lectularius TaxID=79782 RepID=A0A8I6SR88_CIMLE|nr:zinc finger protein PLAG1-like [Cimex lectularius]